VAEGARLESVFTRKGNVGSNPTLSASFSSQPRAIAFSCMAKSPFNSCQYHWPVLCSDDAAHPRIMKTARKLLKNTKFVVKVNRGSTRATEYVQRVDLTPIRMTSNRKLALVMGRFTAEDAVKSLQNSRCTLELVSVQVLSPEAPR
jgi:hypothetical protein